MKRVLSWLLRGRGQSNIFWVTPMLAVGGVASARDPGELGRLGIRAVLDVRSEGVDEHEEKTAASLRYLRLPVDDFAAPTMEQLDEATAWVLQRMGEDERVFVHCREGLGRSVTFAIATLLRMGFDLPHSYNLVRNARAEIAVSDPQVAALHRYAERLGGSTTGSSPAT